MVYFPGPAGLFVQLFLLPSNPEFPAPLQDFLCVLFFSETCSDCTLAETILTADVKTTHFWELNYLYGLFSPPIYLHCFVSIFTESLTGGQVLISLRACLYGSSDVVLSKPWLNHIPHPLHTIFDSQGWWGSFSSEAKKSRSLQNSQHSPTHHCKHPVRCHGNF